MFRIKSAARLAITVGLIVASNLFVALVIGILPDVNRQKIRERVRFSELVAINAANLAENNRLAELEKVLEQLLQRNPDTLSIAIRRPNGEYRITEGPHLENWKQEQKSANQITIEVQGSGRVWGLLEFCFRPLNELSIKSILSYPYSLILYVSAATCVLAWLAFIRTFRYLDPTKVVPNRVRSALDSLTEGLVLVDKELLIVHANQTFARMVQRTPEELVGTPIGHFDWKFSANQPAPWEVSIAQRTSQTGLIVELANRQGESGKFIVNTNPISGPKNECRGVLVSFDDVSLLERKTNDLADMVVSLRKTQDEIQEQNLKLKFLASRDPLTRCYNRRTFWEMFEQVWESEKRETTSLIMVDIDHFKAINDNHGHSKGDDVLRETGAMLLHLIGETGVVCRYGGEEFAILLTSLDLESSLRVADAILRAFQRCRIGGLNVTASIGLSHRNFKAMDAQHLLDQADQSLYAAKRNGRNQVVRFDEAKKLERRKTARAEKRNCPPRNISYASVLALFTALAARDRRIASLSQRLADLCNLIGKRQLDSRTLYWLEACALVRQTGILGCSPDAPASLTSNDLAQREMTATILRNTFGAEELIWIIHGRDSVRMARSAHQGMGERLDLCHSILECSAQLIELSESDKRLSRHTVATILERYSIPHDSSLPGLVTNLLAQQTQLLDVRCRDASIDCAIKLGPLVDELFWAIGNRDVQRFRSAADRVGQIATDSGSGHIKSLIDSLEPLIDKPEPDFEALHGLVEQVMELCRSTRQALVSRFDRGSRTEPCELPLSIVSPLEVGQT